MSAKPKHIFGLNVFHALAITSLASRYYWMLFTISVKFPLSAGKIFSWFSNDCRNIDHL